ncbi:hypothetical protein ATO12_07025 [Aquimarina atlantica]|uniref:Uncharacterized protein n=1 Tax=Aquimarina atlantica TaxID=1317122 RepID=A0A023BNR2_9FLAO|nr:hypothetical protein [Aquimarina atlantica]EZH71554.1 hypothetical protein ATO12_07025 [Aquimarina atlantica]
MPTQGVTTRSQDDKINTIKATVLSVEEILIMPDDYLTTVLTVKTKTNDTLVFVDMDGFEKLVNKEITITYRLKSNQKKLIVCFDCTSYTKPIELANITSIASKIDFKLLKLKEYQEDEYITTASSLIMHTKDDKVEHFYTNIFDLIEDSTKMKSAFFNYGIITEYTPELLNRDELRLLLE